jgi:hypothetical protein
MTQGHLIFAQNSDVDYVTQAYALALTIKKHNKVNSVCLVTNDSVPSKYAAVFDHIVEIPWGDNAEFSSWKIENRWKLIYASPYDETMVYDSDMLLLESNDAWWDYFKHKDIVLTNHVVDYKGNLINDTIFRKMFIDNDLPNVYFGFHYFKKTQRAFEFYKGLELVVKNWQEVYAKVAPVSTQKFCSMDVSSAIVVKLLDAFDEFTLPLSSVTFVHMKKDLQGWSSPSSSWQHSLISHVANNGQISLSNYIQTGLFHYTEDDFLTDSILQILENINE